MASSGILSASKHKWLGIFYSQNVNQVKHAADTHHQISPEASGTQPPFMCVCVCVCVCSFQLILFDNYVPLASIAGKHNVPSFFRYVHLHLAV